MSEFLTWDSLATYGGALTAVMILTQFTKNFKFNKKVPTQLWSYFLTLLVLYPAQFFTGALNLETAILTLLNGVVISLTANGGYNLGQRIISSYHNTDNK